MVQNDLSIPPPGPHTVSILRQYVHGKNGNIRFSGVHAPETKPFTVVYVSSDHELTWQCVRWTRTVSFGFRCLVSGACKAPSIVSGATEDCHMGTTPVSQIPHGEFTVRPYVRSRKTSLPPGTTPSSAWSEPITSTVCDQKPVVKNCLQTGSLKLFKT